MTSLYADLAAKINPETQRDLMPHPPYAAALLVPACPAGRCDCPAALPSVLHDKYGQLQHWRNAHEVLGPDPKQPAAVRQARHNALGRLAAQFPGILRELERMNATRLGWRQTQAACVQGCAPRFLRVVWDYHTLWHRALAWRRYRSLLGRQAPKSRASGRALVSAFASWYERAAWQTPWAQQVLPTRWLDPEWDLQPIDERVHPKLSMTIEGLLQARHGLCVESMSQALWGDPQPVAGPTSPLADKKE